LNVKTEKKVKSLALRRESAGLFDFDAPLYPLDNKDIPINSRHSGLPGIGCFCNALKKKDSGQAGMTISRCYASFFPEFTNKALTNIFNTKSLLSLTLCSFEKNYKNTAAKKEDHIR
jgi:hypothetical protein